MPVAAPVTLPFGSSVTTDGGARTAGEIDLAVIDQLVVARHLAAALPLEALARVPMRRRHQPAVRVHVELVHADLVLLAASDEPRVEDEEVFARLRIVVGGVVARRAVAGGRRRRLAGDGQELPVAHQLHAEGRDRDVVEQRAGRAPPRSVSSLPAASKYGPSGLRERPRRML